MRIFTFLMVLSLAENSQAQERERSALEHSAPEVSRYDVSVLVGLFPVTMLKAGSMHGTLVGASFEIRALLAKRIGLAITPLAFATGEMDDVDRGCMRRHGGGPRLQLLPSRWPVEIVVGYDLSYVRYSTGDYSTFIFRSVRWQSQDTIAHSVSLRLDGAISSRRLAFRLGLLMEGGVTADGMSRWLSAGVSMGMRLRPRTR